MVATPGATPVYDKVDNAQVFSDEFVVKRAKELGCDIMESDEHTLLIDLDGERAVQEFKKRYALASRLMGFLKEATVEYLVSRSGNTHVVITTTQSLDIVYRIALQAILGSDWRRDAMSLASLAANKKYAVVLFRPRKGD